jgi:hypothetical protein
MEETMRNDLGDLTILNHDYVASVQNGDVKRSLPREARGED